MHLFSTFLLLLSVVFAHHEEDHVSIPTKYSTTIEANIANKQRSYVLEEWYDGDAERARRTFHLGSIIFTFLEDFSSEVDAVWIYIQDADDLDNIVYCDVEAYSNKTHSTTWSRFLTVFSQWMQDGGMDDAEYVGIVGDIDDNGEECDDYNMRGLQARKWIKNDTYNSSDDDTGAYTSINMTTSYYWLNQNFSYATYSSNENDTDIPLRIEIVGHHTTTNLTTGSITEDYDFYHSYEYVAFLRGDESFDSDDILDFYTNMPNWVDECDTTHYCEFYPTSSLCSESQGPGFPEFSDSFEVFFDVHDEKNNATYIVAEWYDYPNDRAHVSFYYNKNWATQGYHQVQLASEGQDWFWLGDDNGEKMSYCVMNKVENISGIDIFVEEVNGHLSKPSKWFHFEQNRTWLGYTTIRDSVSAEKWKAIWQEEYPCCDDKYYITINATTYYYFTTEDWNVTYSNWTGVVPLRLELVGYYEIFNITDSGMVSWVKEDMEYVYEMFGFVHGELDDTYFEPPSNWRESCTIDEDYCTDPRYENNEICNDDPELPVLPNAFEATVECVFVSKNFTIIVDEFYDYDSNREKVVIYPYTYNSIISGAKFEVPYSTHMLEDGDIFWQWQLSSGDSLCGECDEVQECELMIVSQAQGQGISTWFDTDARHVSTTKTLFDWVANNSVVTYLGSHRVRGIPCNQWKHDVQVWDSTFESNGQVFGYAANFTVTYSFMQDYYKSSEIYGSYGVPVRADVKGYTVITMNGEVYTSHNFEHFYNYIKFYPRVPDERWFEPPFGEDVMCNITKYCNAAENFNGVSSSSDEGESSEEYQDWCDDIMDGGLIEIEDSSDEKVKKVVKRNTDTTGVWIVAVVMCIITGVAGVFLGRNIERLKTPKIRLEDDPNAI